MIPERNIIELFNARLPGGRLNAAYESDAEIVRWGRQRLLFTTDEFSAEDLLGEEDPATLGWNIAVGAISDILACGGIPKFYAHALTVSPEWSLAFLRRLAAGIGEALTASGARFIGGDVGRSVRWRCAVSVLGHCPARPVLRRGAQPGDRLYVTGPLGAGNVEAAYRLSAARWPGKSRRSATRFQLRMRESRLVRRYATTCIDTSDGAWNALNQLCDLNQCGFDVSNPPYLVGAARLLAEGGWPENLLFLGECGEYELLFTVRPEREAALLAEARKSGCVLWHLGIVTERARVLREGAKVLNLEKLHISARDHESPESYLACLCAWLTKQDRASRHRRKPLAIPQAGQPVPRDMTVRGQIGNGSSSELSGGGSP